MKKPLDQMTDAELFIECSEFLSSMCDRMKKAHEGIADMFANNLTVYAKSKHATAMLRCSMITCLEGIGDILNGIDLVDETAEKSAPIYEELRRRFPRDES